MAAYEKRTFEPVTQRKILERLGSWIGFTNSTDKEGKVKVIDMYFLRSCDDKYCKCKNSELSSQVYRTTV